MKKALLLFFILYFPVITHAQLWESLDGGLECENGFIVSTVTGLLYDQSTERLEAYGFFRRDRQCDDYDGCAFWNGSNWAPYADGCAVPVFSLINYNGMKFSTGQVICDSWDLNLYKLLENEWIVVESVPALLGYSLLTEINGRFYIGASTAVPEGEEVPVLLEYEVENDNYSVVGKGMNVSFSRANALVSYHDTLFFGGQFNSYTLEDPNNGLNDLVKIVDGSLQKVGNGLNNSGSAFSLCVHRDTLFVGGVFGQENFPGFTNEPYVYLLYYYNGELKPYNVQTNAIISSLVSYNDILYVGGLFTEVNNNPCYGVFALDGQSVSSLNDNQFYSVDGVPIPAHSAGVNHLLIVDDHLFIAGYFDFIGEDGPYGNIAKLSTNLSELNTIKEGVPNLSFEIYPNPAANSVTVNAPNGVGGELIVRNMLGQILISQNVNQDQFSLDLSFYPSGQYSFTLNTSKSTTTKILIRH